MKTRMSIIVAVFLCVPCVALAQQRRAGDLVMSPYVFQNAKGEKIDAELGVLTVPEKRGNPKSNLIELAFVRFKSTARQPGAPVVYLAGGPGGSGIGSAVGARFPLFMAMREIGDVIALDQRGVGMSKPRLVCWHQLNIPLDVAPSRDAIVKATRARFQSCADYWIRGQRVDLSAYNTNESADDLEDLRKALGARKISLWGISYGTHLAFAAIRRHPASIERAILAGIEGPDHTYKLPSRAQRHLEDVAALVKADPAIGKEIPDFLGLMTQVFDKLAKTPAVVEITDPLSGQPVKVKVNDFVMRRIVGSNIGSTVTAAFPGFFYRASKGDYTEAAQVWLSHSRETISSVMAYTMDCASGQTSARRAQIQREAPATLIGDVLNDPFPEVCEGWESLDLGDEFRSPVTSDVPVLFISGTLDARTPVENAEDYLGGFRNATHLILEGAVHSDPLFLSSPKIGEIMLDFMKGRPIATTRMSVTPLSFAPLVPASKKQD